MSDTETTTGTTSTALDYELTVIHPFADYQRGAVITDEKTIIAILAGECAGYVNKRPITA
jgi:hypothetical protein